ncbi:hypothetical protein WP12_10735 [Sphingomonas sp. SRS2]|nr:hypothetical protein WP12_10735 [Sphingomonas sp. SRS2]
MLTHNIQIGGAAARILVIVSIPSWRHGRYWAVAGAMTKGRTHMTLPKYASTALAVLLLTGAGHRITTAAPQP